MLHISTDCDLARLGTRVLAINNKVDPSAAGINGQWGTIIAIWSRLLHHAPHSNSRSPYRVYFPSWGRDFCIAEDNLLLSEDVDPTIASSIHACALWLEPCVSRSREHYGTYRFAGGQQGQFRFRHTSGSRKRYKFRHVMYDKSLGDGFLDYRVPIAHEIDRDVVIKAFAELLGICATSISCATLRPRLRWFCFPWKALE